MAKCNFDFKLAVVNAYLADQFSIVDKSTVAKWVKIYQARGLSGLKRSE